MTSAFFRNRAAGAHNVRQWNRRTKTGDRGSVTVEMVLLTPVLVMLMLVVVFAGRAGQTVEQVRHAADQGARAASMAHPSRMSAEARRAVAADLAGNGLRCETQGVFTTFQTVGSVRTVTVSVSCRVDRSGLDLLGLSNRTIVGTSTEVVDRYRAGST